MWAEPAHICNIKLRKGQGVSLYEVAWKDKMEGMGERNDWVGAYLLLLNSRHNNSVEVKSWTVSGKAGTKI